MQSESDDDEPAEFQSTSDEVEGEDSEHEPVPSYHDVPTWEEAISYMLNPPQAESGAAHTGAPSRGGDGGGKSQHHRGGRPRSGRGPKGS